MAALGIAFQVVQPEASVLEQISLLTSQATSRCEQVCGIWRASRLCRTPVSSNTL